MIITTVVFVALVIFLLSVDASWSNVLSTQRNDLVFEGRNMQYGAYALRKEEPKNLFIALLLAVGVLAGGTASWMLAGSSSDPIKYTDNTVIIENILLPPMPDKPKVDATKTDQPAPKPSGLNNATPVVVDDGHTDDLKSDDELANKKLGGTGDEEDDGLVEPKPYADAGGGGERSTGAGFEIPVFADEMPEFPGGDKAMIEFMHNHVHYSEREIELDVSGTIYLSFVVQADGRVSNVQTEKGIRNGERLAKEAEKALLAMPLWKPAKDNGHPVPLRKRIPLKFILRQ